MLSSVSIQIQFKFQKGKRLLSTRHQSDHPPSSHPLFLKRWNQIVAMTTTGQFTVIFGPHNMLEVLKCFHLKCNYHCGKCITSGPAPAQANISRCAKNKQFYFDSSSSHTAPHHGSLLSPIKAATVGFKGLTHGTPWLQAFELSIWQQWLLGMLTFKTAIKNFGVWLQ